MRMDRPSSTDPASARPPLFGAGLLALLASLALVLAPIGHELGHGWDGVHEAGHHGDGHHGDGHHGDGHHGDGHHGDGHHGAKVLTEATAGTSHGECDGWAVVAETHQRHAEEQFEAAEALHHHPHGLCPGPLSGSDSAHTPELVQATRVATSPVAETLRPPGRPSLAQPPSRGPPVVVDA